MSLRNLGLTLSIGSASLCAVVHLLTFVIHTSNTLFLAAFVIGLVLLFGAVLCLRITRNGWRSPSDTMALIPPITKVSVVGCVLLLYSIFLFVSFYRATGGATAVGIVDGQYMYLNKGKIIRPITKEE
jgi:hypothetical protein